MWQYYFVFLDCLTKKYTAVNTTKATAIFIGFRGLSLLEISSKVLLETPSASKIIVFSTMLLIFGFVISPGTFKARFPLKTFS